MRLIDADELEPDVRWSDYFDEFTGYSISQVNDAQTIEAIPIEWMKTALTKYCAKGSIYYEVVDLLLKDWEKENALL